MASSCRGRERCGRCSSTEHKSSTCKAAKPRCACGGEHEAWSRDCPKLLEENRKAKDRVNGGTRRTVAQPPQNPVPLPQSPSCRPPNCPPRTEAPSRERCPLRGGLPCHISCHPCRWLPWKVRSRTACIFLCSSS